MEAESRRTDHSVEEHLFERGCEFRFFEAVRLLLRMLPDREQVGRGVAPGLEAVRFRSHQSLSFPPSEIHAVERRDGEAPAMTVAFLGLTGPQGTLPHSYAEEILARSAKKQNAPAAFFDLFNHRLISLFYRAWEKHRLAVSWEQEQTRGSARPGEGFTAYLFDLIGMGTAGLRDRMRVRDQALLLYGGLIGQRPHSASALAGMLRDYFEVAVEVEQFRGKWFPLADDTLSYLAPEGSHNELGVGAVAGDAIWNPQARFRVVVGPLTYARFEAFLPGGEALEALRELVRFFAGPALEFDIQLVLLASEVPPCLATDEAGRPPMLGLSSWLDREHIPDDANDVILEGAREAA